MFRHTFGKGKRNLSELVCCICGEEHVSSFIRMIIVLFIGPALKCSFIKYAVERMDHNRKLQVLLFIFGQTGTRTTNKERPTTICSDDDTANWKDEDEEPLALKTRGET